MKTVQFRLFRSSMSRWETLFAEASAFADGVGREDLISVSHSSDHNDGVVTVWYWAERE